ncbi:MAG: hypothetical protein ACN6O6_20865 [Pseudomonas sp.]|uniref:hypothetical protein n=1 Tax=Pseudomonas sp. TaxID=306 RepID=UPI003D0BC2AE
MSDHDTTEDEDFAEDALIQAVENQIEAGEPPAALATLNKLTLVGYERDDILHMMALVLADAIKRMLADDAPFDSTAYEQALRALPELPSDD